jgi:hypothetical protein
MLTDKLVSFVDVGNALSLVLGGTGSVASTNTIDLLGSGPGTAPANIIGNATVFGQDPGIGSNRPELNVTIGTAAVSGGGGTLTVALQAAADTAGTYLPGTWVTLAATGLLTAASLTAGMVIARFPFLPAVPPGLNPRYLRLYFTIATAAFTAGTIGSALVTTFRDDQTNKYAAANYTGP